MCGILGYIGQKSGTDFLLRGISLLEYRGYDSVGIGTFQGQKSKLYKTSGSVSKFKQNFGSQFEHLAIYAGLGHTRWATHGVPSALNAHPHTSYTDRLMMIHNGIVENYIELKQILTEHHITQKSQTDTEIFLNYLDYMLQDTATEDTEQALIEILKGVKGSYAVVLLDKLQPHKMFLFRRKSPLILGRDDESNIYAASDVNAMGEYIKEMAIVPDHTLVVARSKGEMTTYDLPTKAKSKLDFKPFTATTYTLDLGAYAHFMLKEIEEQPFILKALMTEYIDTKEALVRDTLLQPRTLDVFRNVEKVCLIGCGTSYHAAKFGEYVFEEIVSVFSESGGEYKYRTLRTEPRTLYIFLSQSGETADLIGPLEQIKKEGGYTLAICNVINSTLSQLADDVCYMKAGPEISVASTKAFTAQMLLLCLIANKLAECKGKDFFVDWNDFLRDLTHIEDTMEGIFQQKENLQRIAKEYIVSKNVILFTGRNINYPIALEGAIKLKEISYRNCDGMQMGELKHGPLALIDEHSITLACESKVELYDKYISNVREVLSRDGYVIAILSDHFASLHEERVIEIKYPHQHYLVNTILNVLILQLLAYYAALSLGVDIDKPRNLAKSVTVE